MIERRGASAEILGDELLPYWLVVSEAAPGGDECIEGLRTIRQSDNQRAKASDYIGI